MLVGQLADFDFEYAAEEELLAGAGGAVADGEACVEITDAGAVGQRFGAEQVKDGFAGGAGGCTPDGRLR